MTSSARLLPLRRAHEQWRRVPDRVRFAGAVGAAVIAAVLCVVNPTDFTLASVQTLVLVLAALALRALAMAWLSVVVGVLTAITVTADESITITASGVVLLIAVAVVSVLQAIRRDRLGLGRTSADSVIGQVRRRLRVQGEVPPLPIGWHVDIQQRAADGAAIAGDFVSSRVHTVDGDPVLDLVVVDVSGKGIEAGSRALLLSGAVGGLLGAVGPDDFLPKVNSYLMRQRWAAGFATCVYVRIELASGRFTVRTAGHPSPMTRSADGEWTISGASGTLLGVLPELSGMAQSGALAPGDLLVLLTDGVIEDRVAPLEAGERRLIAAADRRMATSAADWDPRFGLAEVLVETVPTRQDDDRAVVVVWRAMAGASTGSGPEAGVGTGARP
jgi:hypothetical protein